MFLSVHVSVLAKPAELQSSFAAYFVVEIEATTSFSASRFA